MGLLSQCILHDHNPPHFHAKYSGHEALFDFKGDIIEGNLPNRASKLVKDWISLHSDELEANWSKARSGEPLSPVEPLE